MTAPVAEGLFEVTEEGPALVGSRCTGCGAHYFPTAMSCRDPQCDVKQLERALLGRTGVLHSWTVQHYQPPGLFPMDPWEPYALGLVEVPEGLRVLGMLTGVPLDRIEIGSAVQLVLEPLNADVVTYKWAPA